MITRWILKLVIRNFSGMFFGWRQRMEEDLNTPFPTLPVIHMTVSPHSKTHNSTDFKITSGNPVMLLQLNASFAAHLCCCFFVAFLRAFLSYHLFFFSCLFYFYSFTFLPHSLKLVLINYHLLPSIIFFHVSLWTMALLFFTMIKPDIFSQGCLRLSWSDVI